MQWLFALISFISTSQGKNPFCSCEYQGDFLKVAPQAEFVALVKVEKYLSYKQIYEKQIPLSMEVKVMDVYKGEEKRKTLTVWGDNGALCRPYLSIFDTSKTYVIAFYKISTGSRGDAHTIENTSDYAISVCGEYWLVADTNANKAFGIANKKQYDLALPDIRSKLNPE